MKRRTAADTHGWSWWYLLLLVPFVAILWVPSYAGGAPAIAGVPFFYWYQFLWVLISAVLTAIVYFVTREPQPGASANPDEVLNEELA
jgi:membrane protein implicated in regulation of membrane protease activity